jgi:hypothetical protein
MLPATQQGSLDMQKNQNRLQWLVLIFTVCIVPVVFAAPGDVQVTSLRDYAFGTVTPPIAGNITSTDRVCVHREAPPANTDYRVTATGTNSATAFRLASGPNQIEYRVRWRGGGPNPKPPFVTLTAGVPASFTDASPVALCGAGFPNNQRPRLRVQIIPAFLVPIPLAGTYTDTLQILIDTL